MNNFAKIVQAFRRSGVQAFRRSGVQAFRRSGIIISSSNDNADKVIPNFIYNRFDLWTGHEDCTRETLHISDGTNDYYVQVLYENDVAELGLYHSDIPARYIKESARYIFRTHKEIQQIKFAKYLHRITVSFENYHFRIELPASTDELNQRLTHKFKYNMRRERRLLEAEAGSLSFEEYDVDNFPDDLFTSFFRFKGKTHNTKYHVPDKQYMIDACHVSNAYAIRGRDGKIISIVLSCEQCPIVYIENITYDTKYAKYSPGKMIYHYFLEALIRKGKKELYLGYGRIYAYKKHYKSIEERAFTGVIHRYLHRRIIFALDQVLRLSKRRLKQVIRKILPERFIKFIKQFMR